MDSGCSLLLSVRKIRRACTDRDLPGNGSVTLELIKILLLCVPVRLFHVPASTPAFFWNRSCSNCLPISCGDHEHQKPDQKFTQKYKCQTSVQSPESNRYGWSKPHRHMFCMDCPHVSLRNKFKDLEAPRDCLFLRDEVLHNQNPTSCFSQLISPVLWSSSS